MAAGDETAWYDVAGKYRQVAADLDAAWKKLTAQRAYAEQRPALKSDYDAALARIQSAHDKLQWLEKQVGDALGWFKSAIGLQGLGLIWIPVTAALGAIAYVSSIAADTWALSKRIEVAQQLESKGLSPAQAAQLAERQTTTAGGGLFNINLGGPMVWIAVGGLALGAWWYLGRQKGRG